MSGGDHLGRPDDQGAVHDPTAESPVVSTTVHQERAVAGTELHESGAVRVRKHVETYPVTETVPRSVEHVDTSERVAAVEGDSGEVETLPDGSVSIPVFEEVLVVTKKLVVRERVIVRKNTVVDEHTLETELRREHVTIDADGDVTINERTPSGAGGGASPATATGPTATPGAPAAGPPRDPGSPSPH